MNTLRSGTPAMDVYQSVKNAIIQQTLKPGTALTENSLCAQLGVGRSPVRAALQLLADEGFVELLPNRGAHVATFTEKQLRQLCALRGMVLSFALEQTIDLYTEADLAHLEDCLTVQEDAFARLAFDDYITAVSQFYTGIIKKAGNPYLNEIAAAIINRIAVYLCLYDNFYSVKKTKSLPLHSRMLEGIREGKIKKVLRAHSEISARLLDTYGRMVPLNGGR